MLLRLLRLLRELLLGVVGGEWGEELLKESGRGGILLLWVNLEVRRKLLSVELLQLLLLLLLLLLLGLVLLVLLLVALFGLWILLILLTDVHVCLLLNLVRWREGVWVWVLVLVLLLSTSPFPPRCSLLECFLLLRRRSRRRCRNLLRPFSN